MTYRGEEIIDRIRFLRNPELSLEHKGERHLSHWNLREGVPLQPQLKTTFGVGLWKVEEAPI